MRGSPWLKMALAALMLAGPMPALAVPCAGAASTGIHARCCGQACCCGCETGGHCTCTAGERSGAPQPAVPSAPERSHDAGAAAPATLVAADAPVPARSGLVALLRPGPELGPGDVHLDNCALRC